MWDFIESDMWDFFKNIFSPIGNFAKKLIRTIRLTFDSHKAPFMGYVLAVLGAGGASYWFLSNFMPAAWSMVTVVGFTFPVLYIVPPAIAVIALGFFLKTVWDSAKEKNRDYFYNIEQEMGLKLLSDRIEQGKRCENEDGNRLSMAQRKEVNKIAEEGISNIKQIRTALNQQREKNRGKKQLSPADMEKIEHETMSSNQNGSMDLKRTSIDENSPDSSGYKGTPEHPSVSDFTDLNTCNHLTREASRATKSREALAEQTAYKVLKTAVQEIIIDGYFKDDSGYGIKRSKKRIESIITLVELLKRLGQSNEQSKSHFDTKANIIFGAVLKLKEENERHHKDNSPYFNAYQPKLFIKLTKSNFVAACEELLQNKDVSLNFPTRYDNTKSSQGPLPQSIDIFKLYYSIYKEKISGEKCQLPEGEKQSQAYKNAENQCNELIRAQQECFDNNNAQKEHEAATNNCIQRFA